MIRKIVIVGGGSAGWLTAGILAAELNTSTDSNISITLVESTEVSTIGVGEGTWPTMRASLAKIGIPEAEFIRECSASFKQGSKFVGWRTGARDEFYYHPFTLPKGAFQCNLFAAWQRQYGGLSFADAVCIQSQTSEQALAPKQTGAPEYAGALNYGYHLDAGKFSALLQKHCVERLSVRHVVDHVIQVNSNDKGDIQSLSTRDFGAIEGDLFIDCSGSRSLLLGQHFKIPWVDQSRFSLNDRAVALQVPYVSNGANIASATIATAQSAGWTWDIGLSSRRGVGYVYSSAHISDDAAESELRDYVAKSIGVAKAAEITSRKLSIEAGHRREFWHRNCVALGMSAGFIEPLEASALALVELSANFIRDEFPLSCETMPIVAQRFNKVFTYRWQRVVEFLKLHYVLTKRRDTAYWRDVSATETLPDGLKEMLALWSNRAPHIRDFIHVEEIFPAASYQYVLYGMGFKPQQPSLAKASDNLELGLSNIAHIQSLVPKHMGALPTNRQLIDHIMKSDAPKA